MSPPLPWSPAAVSAHANATVVAAYLRRELKRNGIDDQGSTLVSSVNCVVTRQSPDGQEWKNAAWIGTQMVYGQGRTPDGLRTFAVGLDVVAHEMFHGVTAATARLQYVGEAGALNESYSDIFGVLVSNAEQPDIAKWDWEIGEELDANRVPLRAMNEPGRYAQPQHMRDYRHLPETEQGDYGGVHANSGIPSYAMYLLASTKGADGRSLFDGPALAGIFYVAMTQYLSRTSGFTDARRAAELAARSLFRKDPNRDAKVAAVSASFEAVGIAAA